MDKRIIDTDMPKSDEHPVVRLAYNSPFLEDYGDLHKLTHTGVGTTTDALTVTAYSPEGILEP